MMFRPKPNETEDDLLRQEAEFKAKLAEGIVPAAKVVRVNKRKPEDPASSSSNAVQSNEADQKPNEAKPRSRFSEGRMKKKKEGIIDNTILKEAVSKEHEAKTVLNPVIARDVPSVSHLMAHWQPPPSPYGFPQVPSLKMEKGRVAEPNKTLKTKSLYMRQMEQELKKETESTSQILNLNVKTENNGNEEDYLNILGDKSYILDKSSGLGKAEEAKRIHEDNISKLVSLTHEERLRERDEILSKLSEEQVNFILSFRRKKDGEALAKGSQRDVPSRDRTSGTEPERLERMDLDQSPKTENIAENCVEMRVKKEKEEESKIEAKELPIPPQEAKKWMHMDKIEMEKLKWMTNLPQLKPLKGKEGFVARFNFQGDLLPYDAEVSWREGLHHHGEEPERPGYSLDELFLFVRSQVVQQRHLGLKTLGNILRNASEGLYDTCFETPITQLMVDAGLVLLLRFAMDENTALVYQQALRAMYYLMSSEPDERCLSISEPWTPLAVQPGFSSSIHSKEKDRKELDVEEKELKDVEVIKLDVVRALVRMDLHIRARYLLECETMSPPDVIHIIGMLKRIARHSLTAAWKLVETPRLIETIAQHFLPHNTTQLLSGNNILQLSSVYGVPLSSALSLMKVLASRGRQLASVLVEKTDLMNRILTYVSLEPTEVQMPIEEVLFLSQEAYCLWSMLLSYNLTKAQEGFVTFYPLFVRQLIFYRDKVDINENIESNQFNYEIGCHLLNVLTKGLSVAATETLLTTRMENKEPSATSLEGKELVLQPPVLRWSDFNEVLSLVELCFSKWTSQAVRGSDLSFSGFKLLGGVCSFLTTYYDKWRDQKQFSGVEFVKKMEQLKDGAVNKLCSEEFCHFLFKNLRSHSALCSGLRAGKSRDPVNLGSLGSVCEGGKVTPLLQKSSALSFTLPFVTMMKTIYNLCPALGKEPALNLLNSSHLKRYFTDVCEGDHSLVSQWFTRIEVHIMVNILQLANIVGCNDMPLCHLTAFNILPLVQKGDEHLIKSLLTDVISNPDFVQDLTQIEIQVDELVVKEFRALKSPGFSQPVVSPLEMTKQTIDSLHSIGENLVLNLLHSKVLERSAVRYSGVPFLINDLYIDTEDESTVLDYYWSLTPLSLLSRLSEAKKKENSDQTKPAIIAAAVKWLQMTFLILKYRKSVVSRRTHTMGWFRHLSNVFLASNDIFLNSSVSSYAQLSLAAVLEGQGHEALDPLWTHDSLQPSYDWYKRITEHFGSVSYGDYTFAFFVIVPLLRKWPSDFRSVLFGEFLEVVSFIRLSCEEVSQFIPLEKFLSPPEVDVGLIKKYRMALHSRLINETRNPFLYKFVIHHITNFKVVSR